MSDKKKQSPKSMFILNKHSITTYMKMLHGKDFSDVEAEREFKKMFLYTSSESLYKVLTSIKFDLFTETDLEYFKSNIIEESKEKNMGSFFYHLKAFLRNAIVFYEAVHTWEKESEGKNSKEEFD